MDHGVETVFAENLVECHPVEAIDLYERHIVSRYTPYSFDCIAIGIRQVIDDHDIITRFDKLDSCMRAYITGSAGY
jgi:hypothetical protein